MSFSYSPNSFIVFYWFPSLSHQSFFICISCSCCSLLLLLFLFLLPLLLLLLTWGMVALKIKAGGGLGERAQRLPPGRRWEDLAVAPLCLVVVPYLAFAVAAVVCLVLVVSFVAACVWLFFEVLNAICRTQARTSVFRSPRGFCGQWWGLNAFLHGLCIVALLVVFFSTKP